MKVVGRVKGGGKGHSRYFPWNYEEHNKFVRSDSRVRRSCPGFKRLIRDCLTNPGYRRVTFTQL